MDSKKIILVNNDVLFFKLLTIFNWDMHKEFPDIEEIKTYLYNGTIYDTKNVNSSTCGDIFKNQYNPIIIILEKDYYLLIINQLLLILYQLMSLNIKLQLIKIKQLMIF